MNSFDIRLTGTNSRGVQQRGTGGGTCPEKSQIKGGIPPLRTTCRRHTVSTPNGIRPGSSQWAARPRIYRPAVEEILNTRPYPSRAINMFGIINLKRN